MAAQLNIIIAHLYKDGLDKFGGMNIYTREEAREKVVKGRATDVETFEFVESLLKENISKLPKKTSVNEAETSMLKQGFAAALLAQLYFNAVPYTKGAKGEMWAECAKICEDIINGVYGPYKLGEEWNSVFKHNNYTCGEIICGIPSNSTYSDTRGAKWEKWLHYNTKNYLGGATGADPQSLQVLTSRARLFSSFTTFYCEKICFTKLFLQILHLENNLKLKNTNQTGEKQCFRGSRTLLSPIR